VALDFGELLSSVGKTLLEVLNLRRHFGVGKFTFDDRVPGMTQDNHLPAANTGGNRDAAKYFFSF